ncbi:Oidioi.mRNA.OKI2018_I69.chr1.g1466.t1.cds [Oikopleura dioica]|uniref:Oidioi.mRNA.OKI2018_I69.chr1.g1466.t1.cds n=1 Tax=Oikopleura dioica TaxID=34765 RepID=A0ABN7SN11_OIKDI|nr:Oidioi.mRNA.OKI2018_I69.chr1.g1466.t1.cds [Oikopleura dioica]
MPRIEIKIHEETEPTAIMNERSEPKKRPKRSRDPQKETEKTFKDQKNITIERLAESDSYEESLNILREYFCDEEGRVADKITNYALELCEDLFSDLAELTERKSKPAPAKRGPGRPRKNPPPPSKQPESDDTQLEDGEIEPAEPTEKKSKPTPSQDEPPDSTTGKRSVRTTNKK